LSDTARPDNVKTVDYLPALDSIRGLAFISIFLFHTLHFNNTENWWSSLFTYLYQHLFWGIDVFFILSSFLLTWLGLKEYHKKAKFSIKHYFARRILRIWPLYFFILASAYLIFPIIATSAGFSMTLPNPWYYIFFIANFYHIPHVFFLTLLWTISVEEQFYFIWGFTLKFLKKYLFPVVWAFIIISFLFGIIQTLRQKGIYFNTLLYLFNFACGALAAIIFFDDHSPIRKWMAGLDNLKTIIFYLLLPVQFLLFFILSSHFHGVWADLVDLTSRFIFVIYIAALLLEQTLNKSRCRILEINKATIFTGKISYGLYCYHGITITFVSLVVSKLYPSLSSWISILLIFVINYLAATFSYFKFELPFLKLKSKFR